MHLRIDPRTTELAPPKPDELAGSIEVTATRVSHTKRSARYRFIRMAFFALVAVLPARATPRVEQNHVEPAAKTTGNGDSLPLKPTRTVEFTTDEGTWLSLDVSPDGRTIVFDLLGDLYTMPVTGGEAKKLTEGMGFNSQPRYSPDGTLIAFVSDRSGAENVWVARPDGSDAKVLSHDENCEFASPSWTPDGHYVAVSRQNRDPVGGFELWMYHLQGGKGVQITHFRSKPDAPTREWVQSIGPTFSTDGRYIYYSKRAGSYESIYNVRLPLSQVVRRDTITGTEEVVTDAVGSGFRPLLSPDGTKLVYATRHDTDTGLRIRDLRSGEEHWLRYPVQRDVQETAASRDLLPNYAFTPDGRELVVTWAGKIHAINLADGRVREIPFTANVTRNLGPNLTIPLRVEDGPVRVRIIQAPVQSPDGTRIAFSALTHIYVMELPSGIPHRVTSDNSREFQPAWSPDGRWLTYVTWNEEGGQIWKVAANNSGSPRQLTRIPAYYRNPAFSPDGKRIVALRTSRQSHLEEFRDLHTGTSDLIWIDSDGGTANLVLPVHYARQPHFGPENDRIYIYVDEALMSLRYDGSDHRSILRVTDGKSTFYGQSPGDRVADDIRIGPDGNWALVRMSGQLYVLAVPPVRGDLLTVDINASPVPLKKVTIRGADYIGWSADNKTVTWALGSTFFRLPLKNVAFEPSKISDADGSGHASAADRIDVNLEFPRYHPRGIVVFRGARVITMKDDAVLQDADIVINNNRIAAVGKRGSVSVPPGAKIFDVSGATIVPGFINVHTHSNDIRRGVLDVHPWFITANLAYGMTTVREPGTITDDMFAYQDLIDVGEVAGPRQYSTGPILFTEAHISSLEDAEGVVEKNKEFYRTPYLKSYLVGNRRQRQWIVMASKSEGVMPTTEGGGDAKLDLTHVIDGFSGNEHSLPETPLYRDVVELIARSGVSYTPTLMVNNGGPWAENSFYESTEVHDDPKFRRFVPHNIVDSYTRRRPIWVRPDEWVFPRLAAQDAKIIKAGGRVCVGNDGQTPISYHWEMVALASGGMGNMEVLKSATIHGAEALGLAQDLGSIEPGKLADLVILNKDPIVDIHNTLMIRYVMKDGELFDGNTLNEVWPVEKPLAPMWWWDEAQ